MTWQIRLMSIADYDSVYRIWRSADGLCLGDDDTRDRIALYLRRNPKSCFVALLGEEVVGAVLCGHEGRRGILRHLAVSPDQRKKGIGASLVRACLDALSADGIKKCNIFVMDYNVQGMQFWERIGFCRLADDYRTLQLGTQMPFTNSNKPQ